MGQFYEKCIRPVLFKQDPEKAHERGVTALKVLGKFQPICKVMEKMNLAPSGAKPVELFGLKFPNRVGLAAGMDKNAVFWPAAGALGFGHVEIGTVTYHKQPGNPRPRVFRYPEEEAVINRMGFNNEGAEYVAKRLAKQLKGVKNHIPLGVNIGKSKITPLDEAVGDYLNSFRLLADYADYFTLNVSSPNTPGLRELQGKDFLPDLLGSIAKANSERSKKLGTKEIPVLLKIAPDLTFREIDGILETLLEFGFAGIIATNTTLSRPGYFQNVDEAGGLSGRPVRRISTDVIKYIHKSTEGKLPIIGVGGIDDSESAGEKIDAGATLVQVYTGFIYRGPLFPRDLARGLATADKVW